MRIILELFHLWDSSGAWNLWLQDYLFWPDFWRLVSAAGSEGAHGLLILAVYLALDRRLGVRLFFVLLSAQFVNSLAKLAFHEPRPFWIATMLVADPEGSFGLPSGHAQKTVAVWGALALSLIRMRRWPSAPVLLVVTAGVVLVSLSRLVLGVHFIQDVVVGLAIGLLLLGILRGIDAPLSRFLSRLSPPSGLLLGLAAMLLVLDAGAILQGVPEPLARWSDIASRNAGEGMVLSPVQMRPFLALSGSVLGVTLALLHGLPESQIQGGWWSRLLATGVCVTGVGILYWAFSIIFPTSGLEGALLRIFHQAVIVFSAVYGLPLLLEHWSSETAGKPKVESGMPGPAGP